MDLFKNRNFTPMLLSETNKPFNDKDYLFEIKFDGERALLFGNKKEVKIYNRKNKDISYLYPELQNLKKLFNQNYIFDGEIIAVVNGVPSFRKLQERMHLKDEEKIKRKSEEDPVIFVIFDILYKDKNLIDLPLEQRKKVLDELKENDFFIKSKYFFKEGKKLFQFVKKNKLEGIVAKKRDSYYEINTRSKSWIKIKNFQKSNFYVIAYKLEHNYLKAFLATKKENKYVYAGKVLIYAKEKAYNLIQNTKHRQYEVEGYDNYIDMIEPKWVIKVAFLEKLENHELRQPVFIDILSK